MWCPYHPPHRREPVWRKRHTPGKHRDSTLKDGWFGCNFIWYLDSIVDGYAYSTWIQYNVRVSQSGCNMHTASYKCMDHVKAGTPAYIVSFAEDFFVHASKTFGEFSANRSQHSAFQKWRCEHHVFFRSLAHCSVSLRKWMKRVILAILFSYYIYQIFASQSVLGSDRDSAVPLTFLPDMCWSFAGFFWVCVI